MAQYNTVLHKALEMSWHNMHDKFIFILRYLKENS